MLFGVRECEEKEGPSLLEKSERSSFRNFCDDTRLHKISHLFLESSLKTIGKLILIFILSKVVTSLVRNSFCVELI